MQGKNKTLVTPEGHTITFSERESVEIKLNIPKEALEALEIIARKKDLSVESVVKFFIGKGIRDFDPDLAGEIAVKRLRSRKGIEELTEVDLAA